MQTINRTDKEIENIYNSLMKKFTPPKIGAIPKEGKDDRESYDVSDYYGVGLMPYRKDDKVGISLFYDYSGKNSIKSNTIKIARESSVEVYAILDMFRKSKAQVVDVEINIDNMAKEEVTEETDEDKVILDKEDIDF